MSKNCLLAYISMKLRENLSTPLFQINPSFQLSTPFLQKFSNPPLSVNFGKLQPPLQEGGVRAMIDQTETVQAIYSILMSILGKLKITNNHFNNFQVRVATNRGSRGHFRGQLASKSMKTMGFINLPHCGQLKSILNTRYSLQTQDKVNDGQFNQSLDYHSNYQGVIELIFSVFLTKIDKNCNFCHVTHNDKCQSTFEQI